jgi:ribosomal protein S18 acetylase RimI-like enzyme
MSLAPAALVPLVTGWEARLLEAGATPSVQDLFERCADFFQLINGQPTPADEAASFLARELAWPRTIIGFAASGEQRLCALVELVEGVPGPGDWCIGLLVLDPEHRRAGLGSRIVAAVAAAVAQRHGRRLTLVIQDANTIARSFWTRLGFEPYAVLTDDTKYAADVARVAALAGALR